MCHAILADLKINLRIQLNFKNIENLHDNKPVSLHPKNVNLNSGENNFVTFSNGPWFLLQWYMILLKQSQY